MHSITDFPAPTALVRPTPQPSSAAPHDPAAAADSRFAPNPRQTGRSQTAGPSSSPNAGAPGTPPHPGLFARFPAIALRCNAPATPPYSAMRLHPSQLRAPGRSTRGNSRLTPGCPRAPDSVRYTPLPATPLMAQSDRNSTEPATDDRTSPVVRSDTARNRNASARARVPRRPAVWGRPKRWTWLLIRHHAQTRKPYSAAIPSVASGRCDDPSRRRTPLGVRSPLGDVMRVPFHDNSCDSSHVTHSVANAARNSPRKSVIACTVPGFMIQLPTMKLNIKALALTSGILWGLSVFLLTLISLWQMGTGDIWDC